MEQTQSSHKIVKVSGIKMIRPTFKLVEGEQVDKTRIVPRVVCDSSPPDFMRDVPVINRAFEASTLEPAHREQPND